MKAAKTPTVKLTMKIVVVSNEVESRERRGWKWTGEYGRSVGSQGARAYTILLRLVVSFLKPLHRTCHLHVQLVSGMAGAGLHARYGRGPEGLVRCRPAR